MPAKNFDFFKTHKSGCALEAVYFTSMAACHNRFSVIEELTMLFARVQHQYHRDGGIQNYQTYPTIPSFPIYIYIYIYIYICVCVCVCKRASSCIPSHRNLMDRGKTAFPLVSSPSSILPPTSTHCALVPARNNFGACVKIKKVTSLMLKSHKLGNEH